MSVQRGIINQPFSDHKSQSSLFSTVAIYCRRPLHNQFWSQSSRQIKWQVIFCCQQWHLVTSFPVCLILQKKIPASPRSFDFTMIQTNLSRYSSHVMHSNHRSTNISTENNFTFTKTSSVTIHLIHLDIFQDTVGVLSPLQ